MIRIQEGALARYIFESFPANAVMQGVFARLGGVSTGPFRSLNVGRSVGDDPAHVEANHQLIYQALGVSADKVATARQVHGNAVAVVTPRDGGRILDATDALITTASDLCLMLRFADCVPVFLYAPQQHAVGLVHAGWQGTLKAIASKTVEAMTTAYGCHPLEMYAGIGPAIGPCCFEVGPDVLDPLRALMPEPDALISRQQPNGKAHLDLWRTNALQLQQAGVGHIEMMDLCTCCHQGEFYSHRGENGHTGRFAALLGLRS